MSSTNTFQTYNKEFWVGSVSCISHFCLSSMAYVFLHTQVACPIVSKAKEKQDLLWLIFSALTFTITFTTGKVMFPVPFFGSHFGDHNFIGTSDILY